MPLVNAQNPSIGMGMPASIQSVPLTPRRLIAPSLKEADFRFPMTPTKTSLKSVNYPSEADTEDESGLPTSAEFQECVEIPSHSHHHHFDRDRGNQLNRFSINDDRLKSMNEDESGDSDSSNFEELMSTDFRDIGRARKSTQPTLEAVMYTVAQMMEKKQEEAPSHANKFTPIEAMTTSETMRQDFHVYLKNSGFLGAIGTFFLALYELDELPPEGDAAEFIYKTLGYSFNSKKELEERQAYNEILRGHIQRLSITNDGLRRQLDNYLSKDDTVEMLDPDLFHPKLNPKFPPRRVKLRRRVHSKKPIFPLKASERLKTTMSVLKDAISKMDSYESNQMAPLPQLPKFEYPSVWRDESLCEIYHGIVIKDPYRWLEEEDSDRVREFIRDQNELTMEFLKKCPKREMIRKRLNEILNYERISSPFKAGTKYYYFKNSGLQNQSVMYVQDVLRTDAKVFFDPNLLSEDGTIAITDYKFSEDGSIFAYGLSQSGSDWITIYFKNAITGEVYPDKLERVKFSNISWTHDNLGVFYACYPPQPGKMDGSETTRALNQKIYYHRIGTTQTDDVLVIDFPDQPTWHISAEVSDCGKVLILIASEEISREYLFFAKIRAKLAKLTARPLVTHSDARYSYITNIGKRFYFETNLNAPNNRIISMDITDPAEDRWETVVPEDPNYALDWAKCVANDKLILCYIENVKHTLGLYNLSDGSYIKKLPLEVGTVTEFSGTRKSNEIFFQFSSFLTRGRIYHADLSKSNFEITIFKETKMNDVDSDNFVVAQVFFPSTDGVSVPMFIIHKKGLRLDEDNICLLYGYGGYGVSVTPGFYSIFMVIIQNMNGVVAVANIRGGGEYGEDWHKGGILNKKQNSFNDFQAAAEYLIRMKYTKPSKLVIKGRSNGGLLVAACVNQRPDLFGAAIAQVGVMDLLRFDKFTIGHAWCSDYGKPSRKSDFENLLDISPLHNVNEPEMDGVQYPAVLLFTADHDDRVVPLHSYKLIAELQYKIGRLPRQTNPLMLRVDTQAGHGFRMPIPKWIEEETDILCFILQALGGTDDFTPVPVEARDGLCCLQL